MEMHDLRTLADFDPLPCRRLSLLLLQAKHHPDLIMCRKQPGIASTCNSRLGARLDVGIARAAAAVACLASSSLRSMHGLMFVAVPVTVTARHSPLRSLTVGRLCAKCDGHCVICDSYVRPATLVRICDECNYGEKTARCTHS